MDGATGASAGHQILWKCPDIWMMGTYLASPEQQKMLLTNELSLQPLLTSVLTVKTCNIVTCAFVWGNTGMCVPQCVTVLVDFRGHWPLPSHLV